MQRREFVKSLMGSALLWNSPSLHPFQSPTVFPQPDPEVERVLVMFKCHFDAGFIDTQAAVVHKYFAQYFPHAMTIAAQMRQSGDQRYVWTTGSWLVYEYLEQASPEDRKRMEQAIAAGDIAWHALPFSWQTEMLGPSLIAGGIGLSQALDKRYGRTTTGAKMTDVPGHTRGLIAPLAAQGVRFLDIGVNDASAPAEVPPLFLWRDPKGAALVVMYHHGYGGVTRVPGSHLAVAIVVRGDNSGPHPPQEIAEIYSGLGRQFPKAKIVAANLSEIANAVEPHQSALPVVTQEIGDTWIYGIASDPLKVARYREVARLREQWLAQGDFRIADPTDVALLRRLLLEPEHTWGTDTKTWLDFDHYTPDDLAKMLDTKNYKVVQFSWTEKRQDLFDGIANLPAPLRQQAETAVAGLTAKEPSMPQGGLHRAEEAIDTLHYVVGIDAKTGAINRLRNKETEREWASADHPLALFSYQTLSQQDYSQFFASYIKSTADWAKKDFGKPNMERFGATSQTWLPALSGLHVEEDSQGHRLLARLEIQDAEARNVGRAAFPGKMYLELLLPKAEPVIDLNFYWFDKPSTRLPEALWLSFQPTGAQAKGWTVEKAGEPIAPLDVVESGNRHMHAVSKEFRYQDSQGALIIEPLDAPLVALGKRSPLYFSNDQPDLAGGVHCNLFNNAWGTNYIMWFGEDMRFRFVVRA